MRKLFAICSFLCCSSFYFGYCLTYISTIPPATMALYFGQAAGKASVIGVLIGAMVVGAAFGALSAPLLLKLTTRK